MKSTLILCMAFSWYSNAYAIKAGDIVKICKKSDPHLNQCLTDSMNELRPKLVKGIPELKVRSFDPLLIPEISVKQGTGPIAIDSNFKDVHLSGLKNYKVIKTKSDLKNNAIEFEMYLPYLLTHSNYTMKGKMIALPIQGKGFTNSNYTDISGTMKLEFDRETRNSKQYIKVKTLKFDLGVRHADIHMDNLFNGNKQLGDTMNRFMTDNWEMVYKELKPAIEQAVSAIATGAAVKFFNKFPEQQILPD